MKTILLLAAMLLVPLTILFVLYVHTEIQCKKRYGEQVTARLVNYLRVCVEPDGIVRVLP